MNKTGTQATLERPDEEKFDDHLGLIDIDHIELYVNNAKQAAIYYQRIFGFKLKAYGGLETGVRDKASWILERGVWERRGFERFKKA